jgi:polyhydroxyalkanoate synthesis regulator phasin
LTIEHELCQALANSIPQTLVEALLADGNMSAEERKQLVSEDPGIIAQRESLEGRRKRLKEIKCALDGSSMWSRT